MNPTLKKRRNRLEYRCLGSEDYVRCIRAIARTRDTDAIVILADLLDSSGPIAREAMTALVGFGEACVVEVKRRHEESMDGAMIAVHTREVLARVDRRAARIAKERTTRAAQEIHHAARRRMTATKETRRTTMNNQNAIHFVVTATVETVLRTHGIPPHAMKHAVADVTVRIIEATAAGSAPRSAHRWQRLAGKTAARCAVEERGCTPASVTIAGTVVEVLATNRGDDPNRSIEGVLYALLDNPESPDRTRAQIALLLSMLDQGELPALSREILTGLGERRSQQAVASALGITKEELRARLRTMRTRFFRRLAEVEDFTAWVVDDAETTTGDGELAEEEEER